MVGLDDHLDGHLFQLNWFCDRILHPDLLQKQSSANEPLSYSSSGSGGNRERNKQPLLVLWNRDIPLQRSFIGNSNLLILFHTDFHPFLLLKTFQNELQFNNCNCIATASANTQLSIDRRLWPWGEAAYPELLGFTATSKCFSHFCNYCITFCFSITLYFSIASIHILLLCSLASTSYVVAWGNFCLKH